MVLSLSKMFKPAEQTGWGNISLMLTMFVYECEKQKLMPYIHSSLLEDGRSKYITFNLETTEEDLDVLKHGLFINQHAHQIYCNLMSTIIKPTDDMKVLINDNVDIIKDVKCALHIRRGANQEDSSKMGCHSGNPAYFATDDAVKRFKDVIRQTDGNVFIASDSRELKKQLKHEFGEKVNYLDTDISLSYTCIYHHIETNEIARRNCYLEWFLLSMCPMVYVTAGNKDMTDFSTFGYSAATYGKKPVMMVHN